MTICESCKTNPSELSAVISNVYYTNLCKNCKTKLTQKQLPSAGAAHWARSIDMQDHAADIQQPWGADGKPNADFIRLYPKQAAAVFDEKTMRDASR